MGLILSALADSLPNKSEEDTLTFNVSRLKGFFDEPLTNTTGLILHELAHSKGSHTEHSYHECLTELAQELIKLALKEPQFFK